MRKLYHSAVFRGRSKAQMPHLGRGRKSAALALVSSVALFGSLAGTLAHGAPVVVTPGSLAKYVYLPPGSGSGSGSGSGMQETLQTCVVQPVGGTTRSDWTLALSSRNWLSYTKPVKVFYTMVGGAGGHAGGGGGSSAILKNGTLVAAAAGGDGGPIIGAGDPGDGVVSQGSFEITSSDSIRFIAGGGGGAGGTSSLFGAAVYFSGGGGQGYRGGGGGGMVVRDGSPPTPAMVSPARGGGTAAGAAAVFTGWTSSGGYPAAVPPAPGNAGDGGAAYPNASNSYLGGAVLYAISGTPPYLPLGQGHPGGGGRPGQGGARATFSSSDWARGIDGGNNGTVSAEGSSLVLNICTGQMVEQRRYTGGCDTSQYAKPTTLALASRAGKKFSGSGNSAHGAAAGQIVVQYQAPACTLIPHWDEP